jgi:hypothetical protein
MIGQMAQMIDWLDTPHEKYVLSRLSIIERDGREASGRCVARGGRNGRRIGVRGQKYRIVCRAADVMLARRRIAFSMCYGETSRGLDGAG